MGGCLVLLLLGDEEVIWSAKVRGTLMEAGATPKAISGLNTIVVRMVDVRGAWALD